jgi:transposase InsO family protein
MLGMSKVQKDIDGTGFSNESHHQTMAIQRLGHGHDRQNQPSIQQGHQYILAVMDYFTKWVEAIPMKSVTLKDVINFIKEHAIHRFGIPQTITTDGGSVFISEEFRKFTADMGIKLTRSSPYYTQANGQAETSNRSLIKLIKRKIDEHPRCWHEVLSEALWAHRISCHGATKTSPYHLVYG